MTLFLIKNAITDYNAFNLRQKAVKKRLNINLELKLKTKTVFLQQI